MRKIIGLIDTNVYIPILLRHISSFNNSNQQLKDYHASLQITQEFIHDSIHEELMNLFFSNFGTVKANFLLSRFFVSDYYKFINTTNEQREKIKEITMENPTIWTEVPFGSGRFKHKGIGCADSKFILTAIEIAKTESFDDFNILTYDKPLKNALLSSSYNLERFVCRRLPLIDTSLSPLNIP
jgi:hypothetical protein